MANGEKDWQEWHQHYDDPGSSLAGRLRVVQRDLRRALDEAPREDGRLRLVVMCAGEGRDVLPVLAERRDAHVSAVLVEFDPDLAAKARASAAELGLAGVEVRTADAGDPATYADLAPAHILTACGVFGNVVRADALRTIAVLPRLLADGGLVIWTRGHFADDDTDPAQELREHFLTCGFTELDFTRPDDAHFRVGLNRLTGRPPAVPDGRMFAFV
ncbi:class I SAM-dependent methyltransferase family protein [Actinoplanes sp. NPDC049265]|uniref:class I SAM-dependent methyltransferase family protein n=1 Tax=Actinoplanes sp. NPDC049265 TaxID=3363902 RepID=UPI00371E4F0A